VEVLLLALKVVNFCVITFCVLMVTMVTV